MDRSTIFFAILEVLSLDENLVSEKTLLEVIEFDSIAKMGVISVIDTYLDKIVDAKLIDDCRTLGDIVDLALAQTT